jgi:NADPH:quinone reductase-like Zn-dependent oxidoreductase
MATETSKALIHDAKTHKLSLQTHPTPKPSPTQYLIKTHAVGITKGELLWPEPTSLADSIPAFDVAGIVISTPSPESRFKAGDEIFALTSFSRAANAREFTVVEESELAKLPEGMGWTDAASIPMSALTAWQALFEHASLQVDEREVNKGKRVLIIGASGAVGIWAVQLAKWAGAHVVGVCGTNNVEFVRDLGADEVIDHRKTGLSDWISGDEGKKFDVILDGVGGSSMVKDAWTSLVPNGILISIVQPPEPMKPEEGVGEGVKGMFFIVLPNGKELEKIYDLVGKHKVKTVVDSVWKMEDYEKAFERVESGRARGKVIIEVAADHR